VVFQPLESSVKTLVLVPSLFLAALMPATRAHATTFTLEPNYTQVVFSWDHLGYSHPTAQIAQGQGTLKFDAMDPARASLEVTLPLASLITGVPDLDEHLKSQDFFDVARYPQASFRSTRIEKGMGDDRFKVNGNLTLHGVTRPVVLDAILLKLGTNPRTQVETVGFNATARLKRSEFGLGAFVPQVADEVNLQITCQGAESRGQAALLKARKAQEDAKAKAGKQ
jgi:polyisoprenoid-binding protein YceI